jgi:hypothetical protein
VIRALIAVGVVAATVAIARWANDVCEFLEDERQREMNEWP